MMIWGTNVAAAAAAAPARGGWRPVIAVSTPAVVTAADAGGAGCGLVAVGADRRRPVAFVDVGAVRCRVAGERWCRSVTEPIVVDPARSGQVVRAADGGGC